MDWREPPDEFGRKLAFAREAALANLDRPWQAVEPFEPILVELYHVPMGRDEKLTRVRSLGRQLFAEIGCQGHPVAMEVRHYCWHLQYLHDPDGSPASSLLDMFMVTLKRFAQYSDHPVEACSLCAEFPDDLPYQNNREAGRAYFHEWLSARYGDD